MRAMITGQSSIVMMTCFSRADQAVARAADAQTSAARSLTLVARKLGQCAAKKASSSRCGVQRSGVKEIVASLDRKFATVCGAGDVDRAWVKKGESDAGGRAQVETASCAAEKNRPSTVYQGGHIEGSNADTARVDDGSGDG